jgi:hypothetical protein
LERFLSTSTKRISERRRARKSEKRLPLKKVEEIETVNKFNRFAQNHRKFSLKIIAPILRKTEKRAGATQRTRVSQI